MDSVFKVALLSPLDIMAMIYLQGVSQVVLPLTSDSQEQGNVKLDALKLIIQIQDLELVDHAQQDANIAYPQIVQAAFKDIYIHHKVQNALKAAILHIFTTMLIKHVVFNASMELFFLTIW